MADAKDTLAPRERTPAQVFGIKAKLFVSLATLAALTALASAVAWFVFADIDNAVNRITSRSVPDMVVALSLAERSAEIAATAPAIMASANQEERVLAQTGLRGKARDLVNLIDQVKQLDLPQDRLRRLDGIDNRIITELETLGAAVEQRLRAASEREARATELATIHAMFLDSLEPLVDDAVFDLVISGEKLTEKSASDVADLVDGGVSTIDHLLTIMAEGNLAAGLLAQAHHVDDVTLIQPLRERFDAAAATIERNLRNLPDGPDTTKLHVLAASLLALGQGEDGIFAARLLEGSGAGAAASRGRDRIDALNAAHDALLTQLTPMVDDATFDLIITSEALTAESTAAIGALVEGGVNKLQLLLGVRAEGNLAAGLLNQAAGVTDAVILLPLRERFVAASAQIERMLASLPGDIDTGALSIAATALMASGGDEGNIFERRRQELAAIETAQRSLQASRALALQLGEDVAGIVTQARRQSDLAQQRSAGSIERGRLFTVGITALGVLGALAVMFFYVRPRIVAPIEDITKAMTELAAGNTNVVIPGRARGDELGRMADALGVFRDAAIALQAANRREIRDTRRRLIDAIESISEAFSLYDANDRLVVCNSKYREFLYQDIDEEIQPGMMFESIVRRAAEKGYIKDAEGRIEEWLAERVARHRNPKAPHVQHRGDGRSILVSERKTDDGGTVAVYSDITELKQRENELAQKSTALEQLSSQLAKYLSPQIYESIFSGRQEAKVAASRKKLTVFFSDIAGFTETADRLESEELTELLNHYLTEMSTIALAHGATIDKYVGDAIVIFFGDPETRGVKEDALACARMAIEMRDRMKELQAIWLEAGIENPLACRMGINTGYCTVGNFGSETRMDYTIIGGGVNLASRLEASAQPGQILISYETYAHVRDAIRCQEYQTINVKGIAYPVKTYEVIGVRETADAPDRGVLREAQPHLKLEVDPAAMSVHERRQAAKTLRRALDEVSKAGDN